MRVREAVKDAKARSELYRLLGPLPGRRRRIRARKLREEESEDHVVETLLLDLNGLEAVPACFVRPKPDGRTKGRAAPIVFYQHAHGNEWEIGKEELLSGREGLQRPAYAVEFARRGWCALCIDHWNFGDRRGRTESELFKEMLWRGRVLWGHMVYDAIRAVDYGLSRPEVDPRRAAAMGLSMGSTLSWWLGALDERIRVVVDLCCLTDYQALIEARGLDGHGIYYYVPGLLEKFDTASINALIAPRPHLALAGDLDPLTPPFGLDRIDRDLKKVYARLGAPEAWRLFRSPTGHFETAEMRIEVLNFLEKWL